MNDRAPSKKKNEANLTVIRKMAFNQAVNPLHRFYITKAIKIHTEDLNMAWIDKERETGILVYQALHVKSLDEVLVISGKDFFYKFLPRSKIFLRTYVIKRLKLFLKILKSLPVRLKFNNE